MITVLPRTVLGSGDKPGVTRWRRVNAGHGRLTGAVACQRRRSRIATSAFAAFGLFMIGWTGLAANAAVVQRTALARPAVSAASVGRIALGDRMSSAAGHRSAKHAAKVKYYIVPRAGHGPSTLSEIAARTLGNAHLFMTIFKLNKGRVQPNGGRLENPKLIEPGWILELPANASGPGVHFGPLPHPRPRPRPQPSSLGPRLCVPPARRRCRRRRRGPGSRPRRAAWSSSSWCW